MGNYFLIELFGLFVEDSFVNWIFVKLFDELGILWVLYGEFRFKNLFLVIERMSFYFIVLFFKNLVLEYCRLILVLIWDYGFFFVNIEFLLVYIIVVIFIDVLFIKWIFFL